MNLPPKMSGQYGEALLTVKLRFFIGAIKTRGKIWDLVQACDLDLKESFSKNFKTEPTYFLSWGRVRSR